MIHRNARLPPTGRRILVERVLSGRPVAHVAKEMGISRTCAHRWISRYRAHGWDGLKDRSSRPKSCPHATAAEVVADVLTQRVKHREGPTDLALRCGAGTRAVSRILTRAGMPKVMGPGPRNRGTDPGFTRHRPSERMRRPRGHDPRGRQETRPHP